MDCENAVWNGNIPMDLVKDIVSRLPVKSLGRCMCSSKWFYSHIHSSLFLAKHFNRSKFRDPSVLIVQQGCYTTFSESDASLIKQEIGRIPFPVIDRDLYILGSCRGLVLVRLKVERGYVVLLWNPLLEKCKLVDTIIPDRAHGDADADARPRSPWSCVFALGFHEASNDYRVVRRNHDDVVDVYSLTDDHWHRVGGTLTSGKSLPFLANPRKMASYVNGAVHWLASYEDGIEADGMVMVDDNELAMYEPEEDRYVVLSFDFNNELFKVIELHERYTGDDHCSYPLELHEFNGKLALFICNFWPSANYDTWVMMNYPLVESWTHVGCLFVHGRRYEVWPLACTKKENCIYKDHRVKKKHALTYFNAKEDKMYDLGIVAPYECPAIVDFVECLVLLDVENETLEVRTS